MLQTVRPFDVDVRIPSYFKKLENIYFGPYFGVCCEPLKKDRKIDDKIILDVRKKILAFYVELTKQIKMRVDHKDTLLNHLICLDPVVATSGNVETIAPLYQQFHNTLKMDVVKLDSEWRDLPLFPEIL